MFVRNRNKWRCLPPALFDCALSTNPAAYRRYMLLPPGKQRQIREMTEGLDYEALKRFFAEFPADERDPGTIT